MATNETIGLVGVGVVGSALATQLLARGYEVVGCDIDPQRKRAVEEQGASAVDCPAALAESCDRVLLSLMNTAIVLEVVEGPDGLLSVGRAPNCIIDTTTGDPIATSALAERLAGHGVDYLDATISGSSEQVSRREAFARHRDLLDCFSDRIYHLGPAGSGSRAKLASNLVLGLNRLVLAEGLVFAEGLGLDLEVLLEVLKNSPAYSVAMDVKGHKMIDGDFAPVSRVRQHLKDVELILAHARQAEQPLPLSSVHRELLVAAVAAGDGDLDNAAVIRQIRRPGSAGSSE